MSPRLAPSLVIWWGVAAASCTTLAIAYYYLNRKRKKGGGQDALHTEEVDGALEQIFLETSQNVNSMTINDNGTKLLLYGLYKQARVGNASNSKRPSRLDLVGCAKYQAWSKFHDMKKSLAMIHYIRAVSLISKQKTDNPQVAAMYTPIDNNDIVYSDEDDDDESDNDEDDDNDYLDAGEEKIDVLNYATGGMGLRPSTLNYTMTQANQTSANEKDPSSLFELVSQHKIEELESELRRQSEVEGYSSQINEQDDAGQTPLHLAADQGDLECVNLLLRYGANPNATDEDGISILQTSLMSCSGDTALGVIQALLQAGADPFKPDNDGDTPHSIATAEENEAILKLFAEHNS